MKETDDELIARCKDGDMSAFNLIVQRYKTPLTNPVCRFLDDQEAAEDLTQEVFIRIYRNINRYRADIAGFRTWIYRITANLCKNEMRSRRRRSRILVNAATSDQEELIEYIQDTSPRPDHQLEEKELQEVLNRAISSLPEKFRLILVLRDVEGMSYEEISRIVNKPLGTVKSRINRARLLLKNRMKAYI